MRKQHMPNAAAEAAESGERKGARGLPFALHGPLGEQPRRPARLPLRRGPRHPGVRVPPRAPRVSAPGRRARRSGRKSPLPRVRALGVSCRPRTRQQPRPLRPPEELDEDVRPNDLLRARLRTQCSASSARPRSSNTSARCMRTRAGEARSRCASRVSRLCAPDAAAASSVAPARWTPTASGTKIVSSPRALPRSSYRPRVVEQFLRFVDVAANAVSPPSTAVSSPPSCGRGADSSIQRTGARRRNRHRSVEERGRLVAVRRRR